jgi:hypothetical protein
VRANELSEGRKGAGTNGALDHATTRVVRQPDGGFVLVTGEATLRVVPREGGWVVEGDEEFHGWSLRRSDAPGFVLHREDGSAEAARTMPPVGTGSETGLRFVLLEDGRLFRIVLRGPRNGAYDLTGWETTGAYLTARPDAEEWDTKTLSQALGRSHSDAYAGVGARTPADNDEIDVRRHGVRLMKQALHRR